MVMVTLLTGAGAEGVAVGVDVGVDVGVGVGGIEYSCKLAVLPDTVAYWGKSQQVPVLPGLLMIQ